ncbi:hypothetical protein D3C87_1350670 [compost metagenome]
MLLPTMISDEPGRNTRPAVMCTCGRSVTPCGDTPRITTLAGEAAPLLVSEISTTASREAMGRPSRFIATAGCISMAAAWSREIALWISVSAPLRINTTLSGSPVVTSVCLRPASSISMAAKTNTTSASPPAVSVVVSRRAQTLRAM